MEEVLEVIVCAEFAAFLAKAEAGYLTFLAAVTETTEAAE